MNKRISKLFVQLEKEHIKWLQELSVEEYELHGEEDFESWLKNEFWGWKNEQG